MVWKNATEWEDSITSHFCSDFCSTPLHRWQEDIEDLEDLEDTEDIGQQIDHSIVIWLLNVL